MDRATLLFTLLLHAGAVITMVCARTSLPPSCPSDIYCYGDLLHTIQMASIFPDSKTFVDMKMKQNSTQLLSVFRQLMQETKDHPSVDDLKKFLVENFEPAGTEFEEWIPSDWHPSPKFLHKINDGALRTWAENLHGLWKNLGRKMKSDVYENSHLYSIIPVPHPVIVPGGRFREFYYWDSYWIIRGLLLSEMHDTVRGMLENFISIIDRYGFIPNGGRVYYLQRSQPPLFIPMVESYLEFTNDYTFLKKNIKFLEKEFQFWMKNHTVKVIKNGKVYTLCKYNDASAGPRPESYREDVYTAQFMKEEDRDPFYSQLKTAAESGWDFSTRWFVSNGTDRGNLTDIKIKSIIPVDLNAFIYGNAKLLAKYFKLLDRPNEADNYEKLANSWLEAVTEILWHPEVGSWLDYDMLNNVKRDYFYPSNLSPLWTKCYHTDKGEDYLEKVVQYINKSQILVNLGGVPTSLVHSGEQWDYPNAWPPLQYIVIMGLADSDNRVAQEMGLLLAERWVLSNHKAYEETNSMFEKYDATVIGGHGGGGEYEVQLGFGWSNGVIMELLSKFSDRLLIVEYNKKNETTAMLTPESGASLPLLRSAAAITSSHPLAPVFTLILAFGATLTAGCIGAIVYAKRQSPRPDKSQYIRIPGTPNL